MHTKQTCTHTHTYSWLDNMVVVKKPLILDLGSTSAVPPGNTADSLLSLGFHWLNINQWFIGIHEDTDELPGCIMFSLFLTIFMDITYVFKAISHSSSLSLTTVPYTCSITKTGNVRPKAKHRLQSSGGGFYVGTEEPHNQSIDLG